MKYLLCFIVSYIFTQHFKSKTDQKAPLQSKHTKRNGAMRTGYINYHLKSEVSITFRCWLCSTHYTAVRIKNCSKSTSAIQAYQKKWRHAHRLYQLSYEKLSIHYALLSAMFNLLHSSTNQELLKRHLCNQNSHCAK